MPNLAHAKARQDNKASAHTTNYVVSLVYRKDRSSRGGGVLIAVSINIPSNQINSTLFSSVEFLAVNISVKPSLLFCCVYNPPNSSSAW